MVKSLVDTVTDKRYRSRKWIGFLLLSVGTFALALMEKEMTSWIQWATIGYPAFCAANAALKWKGVEA